MSPQFALRNYVAMGATSVGSFYVRPNGVFYSRSSTRSSEIRAGSPADLAVSRFIRTILCRRRRFRRQTPSGNKKTPAKGRFRKGPIIRAGR